MTDQFLKLKNLSKEPWLRFFVDSYFQAKPFVPNLYQKRNKFFNLIVFYLDLNFCFICIVPKPSSRFMPCDLILAKLHHLQKNILLRNFFVSFIVSKVIPPMLRNHTVLFCITDFNYLKTKGWIQI